MEENGVKLMEEKAAKREAANKAKKRKVRRKRIITLVVVLLVVGGIAFGMYSLFNDKEPEKTVWSEPVYRGSIQSMVEGSGTTKAKNSATLTLASGGEVQEVFVTEGQFVNEAYTRFFDIGLFRHIQQYGERSISIGNLDQCGFYRFGGGVLNQSDSIL